MSFVDEWFDVYRRVLTQPTEFFESEDRRDGFGFPLKFALVNLLISGVLSAIGTLVFGSFIALLGGESALAMPIMAGLILALTPIAGLIGIMIGAGIFHILVYLLGGENGYRETLSVVEYYSVLQPISSAFSLIPLFGSLANFFVAIYGIYIQMRGLESFQGLSTGRALAVVLIPIAIVFTIVIAAFVTILAGGLALAAA
jgi:hypothetical protein